VSYKVAPGTCRSFDMIKIDTGPVILENDIESLNTSFGVQRPEPVLLAPHGDRDFGSPPSSNTPITTTISAGRSRPIDDPRLTETVRTVFEFVMANFEEKQGGQFIIDKDKSGGASRQELLDFLQAATENRAVTPEFIAIFQKYYIEGFEVNDENQNGELDFLGEFGGNSHLSRLTYEDIENSIIQRQTPPSEAEKKEIEGLRATLAPEVLELVDRVNTRGDHRVESLLLGLLKSGDASETQSMLRLLAENDVRVVMPAQPEEMEGARARVGRFINTENRMERSIDGIYVEISPTLRESILPTLRNEIFHVRSGLDTARQVSNGRGFPLSATETQQYVAQVTSLYNEIVSSVAELQNPGESVTFRSFYDEMMQIMQDSSSAWNSPEHYFGIGYGQAADLQTEQATPMRELLRRYIDLQTSETEVRAFERFADELVSMRQEITERLEMLAKERNVDIPPAILNQMVNDEIRERLSTLNPSRTADRYYR
jgi:hypothetical protein